MDGRSLSMVDLSAAARSGDIARVKDGKEEEDIDAGSSGGLGVRVGGGANRLSEAKSVSD